MGMVRVALALAVLLSHLPMATFKFIGGGLAVQAFFIVSGFYMALVLDGKYKDASVFYSNRLLRLFPTYFVMLALGAVALFVLNASATAAPGLASTIAQNPDTATILAIENLILIGQDSLFWFTIDANGALHFDASGALPDETTTLAWQGLLVPQAWSLSIELMFYALAPFLARLDWRWIAAIAVASIGLRLAGHWLPVDYSIWQGRFFPTALFMFLLGMLSHRLLPIVERLPKAIGWAAAALLLAYIVGYTLIPMAAPASRWVTYAMVAAATPWIFHAFREASLDRWIGDLSYPIYLSQLIVVGIVLTYEPPFPLWSAIIGTLAISALVLVVAEHPVDNWRQARLARSRARPAPGERAEAPCA
jgi:peptidoglycan/LPS O-acetylase OafA/YrhL